MRQVGGTQEIERHLIRIWSSSQCEVGDSLSLIRLEEFCENMKQSK